MRVAKNSLLFAYGIICKTRSDMYIGNVKEGVCIYTCVCACKERERKQSKKKENSRVKGYI